MAMILAETLKGISDGIGMLSLHELLEEESMNSIS